MCKAQQCPSDYYAKWVNFIDYLHSSKLLEQSHRKSTALIHQRILIFPVMRVTVISGFKASVQTELKAFFAHLANQPDLTRNASAQAFSKACKQFCHRAFAPNAASQTHH
jgi:hypothetical protein